MEGGGKGGKRKKEGKGGGVTEGGRKKGENRPAKVTLELANKEEGKRLF